MLVDLALIGFGNVARRFVRMLDERQEVLQRDYDLEWRVTGLATRRHGSLIDAAGIDATSAARIVDQGGTLGEADPRIASASVAECLRTLTRSSTALRVAVETTTLEIESGRPAIDHVEAALDAGCHVVTANKGPVAFAYRHLSTLADSRGLAFLFEGAVMDGVPIFNLVRRTMPAVRIDGFRGVVNSTTNHILTALEAGQEFGPALARMQAEGIAEADPTLDVDGWDAAAKTSALANVFLDAGITPHEVAREGIGPNTAERARAAMANGRRLRLVAAAKRGAPPQVRLLELPPEDLLANLHGTSNALIFETDTLGRIAITQLDGGLHHTAYALLSDLIAVRQRYA